MTGRRTRPNSVPKLLPLFWVVREQSGARTIFLQPAQDKLYAWLHSSIAGHRGEPIEVHELDEKTARKVPKKMIGRVLTQREARASRRSNDDFVSRQQRGSRKRTKH